MNKIKTFESFEFGQVRTMLIDNEPWFVGMDIAQALGYKRPSDAIASHVYEEDKLKRCFTVSGQGRNLIVINESGMYALIFGSKLESAIRFKNWVTSEVLPSIRKHGGYFSGQEEMNDQELLARGYLVALRQIEARTEELEGLIPKGEFFDKFMDLGDCICLRDTAKELGVSQNRFINILIDRGYLYRNQKGKLRYYSTAADYFKLKDYINKYNGQPGVYTVVRPEGRAYLSPYLKRWEKSRRRWSWMIMLNKKSCINCDERDLVKHNEEINKILGELRKLDNYDCVVLHKYQDIGHRNKDLQVININLWDIYELAELADFKNGVDFLIDDEGFLNLSVYGQTYKLGGESHFIHAVFKIIPHDEDLNFLNISEFILEGKPIRFSDKQLNKKKKSTIALLSEYKEKVINNNTIKKDSQIKEKGEER